MDKMNPSESPRPAGLKRTLSSSSSSSSSSESSNSSSGSGSSSSESENETPSRQQEDPKNASKKETGNMNVNCLPEDKSLGNVVDAPSQPIIWGNGSSNNTVASGSVYNNEIRVVPIKERKERKKNVVLTPREIEEQKNDPTFRINEGKRPCPRPSTSKVVGTEELVNETAGSGQTPNPEEALPKRTLRERTNTPVLNEQHMFRLQHEILNKQLLDQRRVKQEKKEKAEAAAAAAKEDDETPPSFLRMSGRTMDWDRYLRSAANIRWVAPVNFFKHAPFSDVWETFARVGAKVEVPNTFVECNRPVYWVATIRAFAGYKALIEYESFGMSPGYFGWMSFCSDVPKPIGYCDKHRILLFPPYEVNNKYPDFLDRIRQLLGEKDVITLSDDHVQTVTNMLLSVQKLKIMQVVEAMDSDRLDQNRIGKITGIIGDRVHVTYNNDKRGPGFWFNVNSDQIHKIGWSQSIGRRLAGVPRDAKFNTLQASDFPSYPSNVMIRRGMVFETIHPLELHLIVAAEVTQVFRHGYFMAEISCNLPISSTSFCFHIASHWILPVGFAERHNIELTVPRSESQVNFRWDEYCAKKNLVRLDVTSLPMKPSFKFTTGSKMEAIDLRQPAFCGPVTIIKIAEHLLLLHFDGWKRDHQQALQWVDSQSPHIYPVGWAEMVGHEFQSNPSDPLPEDCPVTVRLGNKTVAEADSSSAVGAEASVG